MGPVALYFGENVCEKLFTLMRRATRCIMGLGRNVANEFVDLLLSYDRRNVWKNNFIKVIDKWKTKGLSWKNSMLDKVLSTPLPEPKAEVDLKLWDYNLIETLNLFNRAKDIHGHRMSERRLLELEVNLNSGKIIDAIKTGSTAKIIEWRKILMDLKGTD